MSAGYYRRVDVCPDADPFDAVLTPLSVLAPLHARVPRSTAPRPPSSNAVQQAHAPPPPNRGIALLSRIRELGADVSSATDATNGGSGEAARPSRQHTAEVNGAPTRPPPARPSEPAPSRTPAAAAPTTGNALMKMMQANMSAAEANAAAKSVPPPPKRTPFVAPRGAGAAAHTTIPSFKTADDLRAALLQSTVGPGRFIAIATVGPDGTSTFVSGGGLKHLDLPSPRTAASRVGTVLASFDGQTYSLGANEPGCLALYRVIVDPQLAQHADFCGFGLSSMFLALLSAAPKSHGMDGRRFSDTRIMAWMLRPDQPIEHFDDLVSVHGAAMPGVSRTALDPKSMEGVAARLAMLPHVVRGLQRTLCEQGMMAAFAAVERPLGIILAEMKYHGFIVDTAETEALSVTVARDLTALRSRASTYVDSSIDFGRGATFNVQSPDHCRKVLFDYLHLEQSLPPGCEVTAGGKLSTSEETLKALEPYHALPGIILEYRKLAKLQQTYFEGVFSRAVVDRDAASHRIHATFLQEGTDTGRLSCADPNLQNLPRTTNDLLGAVRRAFVAPAGYQLAALDYEQIELRVLAHISRDESLTTALRSTEKSFSDIHRRIASKIFSKPFDTVTSQERTSAKRVVFGVTYGMGPRALASQLGCSFDDARQIMQDFKRSYPGIDHCIAQTLDDCRRTSAVRTILNRIRYLPDINQAANSQTRALAERQAFNTVIQGSAADVVKKAMVDVRRTIISNQLEAILIGQVHDELIFAVPEGRVAVEVPMLRQVMENCMTLSVPLVVKTSCGPSLGALSDFEAPE